MKVQKKLFKCAQLREEEEDFTFMDAIREGRIPGMSLPNASPLSHYTIFHRPTAEEVLRRIQNPTFFEALLYPFPEEQLFDYARYGSVQGINEIKQVLSAAGKRSSKRMQIGLFECAQLRELRGDFTLMDDLRR